MDHVSPFTVAHRLEWLWWFGSPFEFVNARFQRSEFIVGFGHG
jgi:hypothetical protein